MKEKYFIRSLLLLSVLSMMLVSVNAQENGTMIIWFGEQETSNQTGISTNARNQDYRS